MECHKRSGIRQNFSQQCFEISTILEKLSSCQKVELILVWHFRDVSTTWKYQIIKTKPMVKFQIYVRACLIDIVAVLAYVYISSIIGLGKLQTPVSFGSVIEISVHFRFLTRVHLGFIKTVTKHLTNGTKYMCKLNNFNGDSKAVRCITRRITRHGSWRMISSRVRRIDMSKTVSEWHFCQKRVRGLTFIHVTWTKAELATKNKLAHSNEFYLYKKFAQIYFWEIPNIISFKPTMEK